MSDIRDDATAPVSEPSADTPCVRVRIAFRGIVQGVGFRPYVYRLARELGLTGWVANTPYGAEAEIEGVAAAAQSFLTRVEAERPPMASIQSLEATYLDAVGHTRFEIRSSLSAGPRRALILPDIATCDECLGEVLESGNRRFRYPFTNCTNCGPRYSIILRLPYDRPHTTMAGFAMCADCSAEYGDPDDRRFHAQPNACPVCGPQVELWTPNGDVSSRDYSAIEEAIAALHSGRIVAVKGVGGFHLMVDAGNDGAVERLRKRKRREQKPLALMCPSLDAVMRLCSVSPLEARALTGPERPIVLLQRRPDAAVAEAVAPRNPNLGVMLPYTPLHHLLMLGTGRLLVATSGNVSDEPICTDERDALRHLAGIADLFLVHDRPIARHVDDSILRVILGREQILRRARGYAPLPLPERASGPAVLAVGAHQKNTVAISLPDAVCVSQHIGDLDTISALGVHRRVGQDLSALYEAAPAQIACDLHPDYVSTREAYAQPLPVVPIQHHYAHVLSCMSDSNLDGEVLGVAWDGTGYGGDATIWGGEFLLADRRGFRRVAHLRSFMLPGGDAAVREPRRSALGLVFEMAGEEGIRRMTRSMLAEWPTGALAVLTRMLSTRTNSPTTTSAGRLFDGIAAIVGLAPMEGFEGQAAMELEWTIRTDVPAASYDILVHRHASPMVLDWEPMLDRLLDDVGLLVPAASIARGFHDSLVRAIVEVAGLVGNRRVVLTGGCFQNRYLTEASVLGLQRAGFTPYWHQRVPPNDGGIALGQVLGALSRQGA